MKLDKLLIGILIFMLLLNSGCQIRNVTKGMDEGEYYNAVVSISPSVEKDATVNAGESPESYVVSKADLEVLQTIMEMPGMYDEQAAELFGGGNRNLTADEKMLIGRNYQIRLLEEDCMLFTSYGMDKKLELAYVILPGTDLKKYAEIFDDIFQNAVTVTWDEEEDIGYLWEKDDRQIFLYQDESIILDFGLIPQEKDE